jgi:hypothetical protein
MKEFDKYIDYRPQETGVDSITIEKDVKMPKKNGRLHSILSDEVRNSLKSMEVLSAGSFKKKSNNENFSKSDYLLIQNKIIFLENCIAGIHESFLEVSDLMKEEKVFRNTKTFKKWRETHQKLEQIRKNMKDQIS